MMKEPESNCSDGLLRNETRTLIMSVESLITLRTHFSEMAITNFQPSFLSNTQAISNIYRTFLTGLRAPKASAEHNKWWSRSGMFMVAAVHLGTTTRQPGMGWLTPRRQPPGHWQGTHANLPLLPPFFIFSQSGWLFLIKKKLSLSQWDTADF